MDFYNFLLPSILMGGGIAIDVTIATLAMFMVAGLSAKSWTLPITATHVIFPAFGYYLFWGLSESVPILSSILGLIGFLLVALFIYEVLCESVGAEPIFGISAWIGGVLKLDEEDSRLFVRVLAVSWDALWSGPAKAAQADAGYWTVTEVILSFLVAGMTVAIIAQLALYTARFLKRRKFDSRSQMATWFVWGKWVELSVIGGFGILSLSHGLTGNGNLYVSIGFATGFLGVVMLSLRYELYANALADAHEAMEVKK